MTTPKAILIGLTFIAVAIASIPYSNNVVTPALASNHIVHKIAICEPDGRTCGTFTKGRKGNYFRTSPAKW
tara:strand:- start:87 stop:299 length:213 start_codon:yes stop_codon:yes gene_type:complete